MLDVFVLEAAKRGVKLIRGYYYPTAKNKMVKDLFADFGFERISEDEDGSTVWTLKTEGYENRNFHIRVNGDKDI